MSFQKEIQVALTPCIYAPPLAARRAFSGGAAVHLGKPQMWEQAHVGFGGTGRKRKGPCVKQCAWQKHGLCEMRLLEACPPEISNFIEYNVPKVAILKHCAPSIRLVEVQCAHRKRYYPETPLVGHPTSIPLLRSHNHLSPRQDLPPSFGRPKIRPWSLKRQRLD